MSNTAKYYKAGNLGETGTAFQMSKKKSQCKGKTNVTRETRGRVAVTF